MAQEARKIELFDRQRAKLFEDLENHGGWKLFLKLLNDRITEIGQEVVAPVGSVDGVLRCEHLKGSMYGLIIARDIVPVTIAAMKDSRAHGDDDVDE